MMQRGWQKSAPAPTRALTVAAARLTVVSLSTGAVPLLALADRCGVQASVGLGATEGRRLMPPLPPAEAALCRRGASFCLLETEPAADPKISS